MQGEVAFFGEPTDGFFLLQSWVHPERPRHSLVDNASGRKIVFRYSIFLARETCHCLLTDRLRPNFVAWAPVHGMENSGLRDTQYLHVHSVVRARARAPRMLILCSGPLVAVTVVKDGRRRRRELPVLAHPFILYPLRSGDGPLLYIPPRYNGVESLGRNCTIFR